MQYYTDGLNEPFYIKFRCFTLFISEHTENMSFYISDLLLLKQWSSFFLVGNIYCYWFLRPHWETCLVWIKRAILEICYLHFQEKSPNTYHLFALTAGKNFSSLKFIYAASVKWKMCSFKIYSSFNSRTVCICKECT